MRPLLLLLALSPACKRTAAPPDHAPPPAAASAAEPASPVDTYSNILPADYVGPEVCGECHKENYAAWRSHPHAGMNADASDATVLGDFSGVRLEYGGGGVELDRGPQGEWRMSLHKEGRLHRRYRVTRTIGNRFVQMYAGVQTFPADPEIAEAEMKLPFAWWVRRKEWFPETYDEVPPTPEYDKAGKLDPAYDFYDREPQGAYRWESNCIRCHNTYAYVQRLAPGRRTGWPRSELKFAGAVPSPAQDGAGWALLDDKELVTVGISCESCHLGGRAHAKDDEPIRFLPSSPELSWTGPRAAEVAKLRKDSKAARQSAYVVNGLCRQCHSAVTPGPDYPDGSAIWASREAKDMAGGACADAVRCTHCHDPHEAGPVDDGAPGTPGGPDLPGQVGACIRCHPQYTMPKAVQAHTHHPVDAGVTCLDCHMPRIVHGMESMVRTHRISSPTDGRMYSRGAPNACNLCHLDRSVLWTAWELERKWGIKLNPDDLWKPHYGGPLKAPAGLNYLYSPQPIVRLAAADAFSRMRRTNPKRDHITQLALPSLLRILEDPRPPNRLLGQFAVERVIGRRLPPDEYLSWAPPERRAAQMAALRTKLGIEPSAKAP